MNHAKNGTASVRGLIEAHSLRRIIRHPLHHGIIAECARSMGLPASRIRAAVEYSKTSRRQPAMMHEIHAELHRLIAARKADRDEQGIHRMQRTGRGLWTKQGRR